LIILLSIGRPPAPEESQGEYYFLLIMGTIGLMVLVAAGDLFTAFIALELLSLPVYALAGIRRSKPGLEAAYKYFMLGAFGSGMTVMGIAILNALYPALTFTALKVGPAQPLALAGFLLVISGFAFKTALVPFHMWVPDAYEGAPTQVSAFMAAAVKAGGVVVLWRLFSLFDGGPIREVFWWLAVITAVSANLMALGQKSLKRLLAYSSVAHAGYIAVAFFGGRQGFEAVLYYLPVYAMATIGAFSVALLLEKEEKGPLIEDLAGLAQSPAFDHSFQNRRFHGARSLNENDFHFHYNHFRSCVKLKIFPRERDNDRQGLIGGVETEKAGLRPCFNLVL